MAREYFNHHATRVAIEMSVELDEETQWTGTGFFVQVSGRLEEGPTIDCLLLISNKHVLAQGVGTQGISLNRKDGNGKVLYGQQDWIGIDRAVHRYTGYRDESIDLACLDLRGMGTAGHDVPVLASGFLEKLDYERFGVGSDVLYAGYPNGMKDAQNGLALMRKGSIASIPELDCDVKGLIAIDGTVLEGNSGGPVFVSYDDKYRLLGVMQATSLVADDYGFAIKQEYVNELVAHALEKSANELRAVANAKILERMHKGEMKDAVQDVRKQVWLEISRGLDKVRNKET